MGGGREGGNWREKREEDAPLTQIPGSAPARLNVVMRLDDVASRVVNIPKSEWTPGCIITQPGVHSV